MFPNRIEAGRLLAQQLTSFQTLPNTMIMAIPNGGVMTAYVIAEQLGLPLELELVKKIRHPNDPNCIIGAVGLCGNIIKNTSDVTPAYLEMETDHIKKVLQEKHQLFLGVRKILLPTNKIVILVDDGINTGTTLKIAIRLIKSQSPQKLIVAVPVGPAKVIDQLTQEVDELICLETPINFETIDTYYKQFHPVKDMTIIRLLKTLKK